MEKNNERAMNRTKRNMRTKRNLSRVKDYAPQGVVAFLVLAALLLFFFILLKLPLLGRFIKNVTRALAPAIAGFIFAFIMSPMVRFFETKMIRFSCNRKNAKTEDEEWITKVRRRSRRWSILITLVILLSIISLLLVTIIPELAKSLKNLAVNLADYLRQLKDIIDTYLKHNPRVADALNPVITRFSDTDKLAASITKYIDLKMAGGSIKFIANSAGAVVRILYIWLVGTIVAVYLLASKEYYIGLSKKLFFAILPKRTSKNAIQTLHKANIIYSAAILGKLVDSIIIGMICFIGTSILGFWFPAISEYKVLVSVIVGVTNVIPFFGPFLGGIPCSILILAMRPLDGLIFALFIVALQQFDGNFLDPHIVGKLATPTCALVYYLTKSYLEVRLESKNLPTETKEYVTNPSAVIANRSLSVDLVTERLVAESDALDAAQAKAVAEEEAAIAVPGVKRHRRRHRSGAVTSFLDGESVLTDDGSQDLDLSAYDDLESGVAREKRLEREWLMSGGEEDLNDNGISDELEREHEVKAARGKHIKKSIFRRMIEEAEEDWDEHGNKPLPGSKRNAASEEENTVDSAQAQANETDASADTSKNDEDSEK